MDPEKSSSENEEIAATLNFCDRVEILNMMMHDPEKPLSLTGMDVLLGKFYPSYRQLCEDLRGEKVVTSARAKLNEGSVEFTMRFSDNSDYTGQYNQIDEQALK